MSSTHSQEVAVFQTMLPQLEAEGFEVFFHPSRTMLPPFLRTYQPDAIAVKGDKKIAIEIMSSSGNAETKLERLRKLFSEHTDWELRVVYAPPRVPEQHISTPSRELIEDHLKRITAAFDAIGPAASLLIAWSVFEATARSLIPDLGRPQAPARLLEILASGGYITPTEAEILRRLGRLRNEAAHGRLDATLTREDLDELVRITRTILALHDQATPETPG
jgi:uncharacterized protein YutE (UPF0331/DUF86 family)